MSSQPPPSHYFTNIQYNPLFFRSRNNSFPSFIFVADNYLPRVGIASSIAISTNFTGSINITNSTASTNPTTGALKITGGLGVGGNVNIAGTISASNFPGPPPVDVTLSVIGSSPNADGATLTGQVLNLQPANASFGGVISTSAQTIAGLKTFNENITINKPTSTLGKLAFQNTSSERWNISNSTTNTLNIFDAIRNRNVLNIIPNGNFQICPNGTGNCLIGFAEGNPVLNNVKFEVRSSDTYPQVRIGVDPFNLMDLGVTATGQCVINCVGSNNTLALTASNVGIGTLTPTSNLHVIGDTLITGNLNLNTSTRYIQFPDLSQQTTALVTLPVSTTYTNATVTTNSRGVINSITNGMSPSTSSYIATSYTKNSTNTFLPSFNMTFTPTSWGDNDFFTVKFIISVMSNSTVVSTSNHINYTAEGMMDIYPNRTQGAVNSTTDNGFFITNNINGNVNYNLAFAPRCPLGRFAWTYGTTFTGQGTSNYPVFFTGSGGAQLVGIRINNPNGNSSTIPWNCMITVALVNPGTRASFINTENFNIENFNYP